MGNVALVNCMSSMSKAMTLLRIIIPTLNVMVNPMALHEFHNELGKINTDETNVFWK